MSEKRTTLVWMLRDEVSKAAKNIQKTLTDTNGIARKSVLAGVGIGAGMTAWNALGSAVGNVTGYLSDAVRAAADEERGIARLSTSLRENARSWDGNTDAVEKVIKARMNLAFTDDELRGSLALLVGKTKDLNAAWDAQAVAMDLARYKNISLEQASTTLISAMSGQTRVLKQLGIEIKGTASASEVLGQVQRVTAGQAEAYASTSAGAFETLNITLQDLQEDIGRELLPAFVELARVMKSDVVPAANDVLGSVGHLNWAMAEQRRLSSDLMFWQRGLLGVWTDSQFSAEAYAKALETQARAADATGKEYADLAREMGVTGDSMGELTAANREAVTPAANAAGAIGDIGDEADDAAKKLDDLRTASRKLWDALIEDTKVDLPSIDDKWELEALPIKIREAQREVKAAQDELERARGTAAKDAARLRLIQARADVDKYTAELTALREKFSQAGEGHGYSYGSALRAEVRRWLTLTRRDIANLGGGTSQVPAPGQNSAPVRPMAVGGPVAAHTAYVVGERGPELFVPQQSGTIIPAAAPQPAAIASAPVSVAVYLDSDQIAARVERRQYFAASVAPVSAR